MTAEGAFNFPLSLPTGMMLRSGALIIFLIGGIGFILNDEAEGSTVRALRDVGVDSIFRPFRVESPGPFRPKARLRNYGSTPENFWAYFKIYRHLGPLLYQDSQSVYLLPDSTVDLKFRPWDATGVTRLHVARCSTFLVGDVNPGNDRKSKNFGIEAHIHDVGVLDVIRPVGIIPPGRIRPKARIYNYGRYPETFRVYFIISAAAGVRYRDSTMVVDLFPQSHYDVTFTDWNAEVGDWVTKCSTALPTDQNRANDKETERVRVRMPTFGWVKIGDVPLEPDGKQIRSGGGMTRCGGKLYILKGNNTRSLYSYTPDAAIAAFEDSLPAGFGRKVKKGSGITSDGRYLYIFKGSNTKEFYRYDTQRGDTIWKRLPDVPGRKALKDGTGAAYVPGFVYLLKGSNTQEFYRFNIAADTWETRRSAPGDRGYKGGSCLVAYNDTLLYALQGDFNRLYLYNANRDSWYLRDSLPLYHPQVNRRKKVKEGAAMAILRGNIYAFKGGNTQEFWMYVPERDTWVGKDTLPQEPDRRRVRGGGALAAINEKIYALKGNNTTSIWRWTPRTILLSTLNSQGAAELKSESPLKSLRINSPTSGPIIVYNLPQRDVATLTVYNIIGEVVYSGRNNKGVFTIPKLPPGVYVLRLETKGYREERKLVVAR